MMTEEQSLTQMSNEFDILYNNVMSNKAAPLDEYEKSYFLTKSQYEILKNYLLDTHNAHQEGFDDSSKRQIDFSKIVHVKTYKEYLNKDVYSYGNDFTIEFDVKRNGDIDECTLQFKYSRSWHFSSRVDIDDPSGILSRMPEILYGNSFAASVSDFDDNNEMMSVTITLEYGEIKITCDFQSWVQCLATSEQRSRMQMLFDDNDTLYDFANNLNGIDASFNVTKTPFDEIDRFDDRSILFKMPDNILFTLNEIAKIGNRVINIVPISYGEYSTEISKPYKLPVKNQGWRLYQSRGGSSIPDLYSEVVVANPSEFSYYKIRYVRRPRPIILVDLDQNNGFDSVSIEGETRRSACELDQILFPEIVQRAVELARISYGGDQLQQAQTNMMITTGTRTE